MKSILTFVATFVFLQCFSQSESEQKYLVNSIMVSQDTLPNASIAAHYYTLRNNIDNKASSVYISDKPTMEQILDAAINLPSDFFLINKAGVMLYMLKIENKPERKFVLLTPPYMEKKELKCALKGEISENRANELIKEKYDPSARIEGQTLYFAGKKLKMITNQETKTKVQELIKSEKLIEPSLANPQVLTAAELRSLILIQSQKGGKLDFFSQIKGKEYDKAQLKPGVNTTNISKALYTWGKAVSDLGVASIDDAISIFTEFKKGEEPNGREQDYIRMGYTKILEK
jgi:hypothetical protein